MATATKPAPTVASGTNLPNRPRNIVPPSDFVAHGVSPIAGAPVPSLTNHGGTVLQAVQVVPIYWGAAWAGGTNATLASQIDSFFDFIVTSQLMDMLSEYSLAGTPIQHGSRLTSVPIAESEPGTVTASGRQVTDAQIQTAIQGWINTGRAPAVTANTLYFLYLPPNVQVIQSPTSASCTQFCGYHGSFGSGVYYAVIPFVNCGGCLFSGAFLDTITEVSSHELSESITDPTLSTWWDPNTGNEIGDICNRQTVRLGNYLVQTEWSNSQGVCTISPLFAVAGSHLDGYATTFNNQQHVNFIGNDNHVYELFYDGNQWHHNNLTSLAGAPAADPASSLDGYETAFNSQQHVNFLGPDNHVHELYYSNGWQHNDLTNAAGAPPATPGSDIDGYATTFNQQQHVNFVGSDNHVHELYFENGWRHNDLTSQAGAPEARAGSPLDGYETAFNSQQHVNFIGNDGHIHELYFDGNDWRHNDLSARTGAPPAAPGSSLDGYATTFNNQQHINFLDANNHVHELYFDGNNWGHNDLTDLAGAPPAAAGGALDGYQTSFNSQQHINFLGTDNHVHELYYTDAWRHNDLTLAAGAPNAKPGSSLDGYETAFNSQQHVNFIGEDNHVHELYFINAWFHNDLTLQ